LFLEPYFATTNPLRSKRNLWRFEIRRIQFWTKSKVGQFHKFSNLWILFLTTINSGRKFENFKTIQAWLWVTWDLVSSQVKFHDGYLVKLPIEWILFIKTPKVFIKKTKFTIFENNGLYIRFFIINTEYLE
jgi:hypothetical protein